MNTIEHEILESSNVFEKHILENKPSRIYAFSPKIYDRFNEVIEQINTFPSRSLIYIGNDSFLCQVNFYKASCGITYIFLIDQNGIREYYLLN